MASAILSSVGRLRLDAGQVERDVNVRVAKIRQSTVTLLILSSYPLSIEAIPEMIAIARGRIFLPLQVIEIVCQDRSYSASTAK